MSRFDPSQFIALVVDARHFERGLTLEHLRLMGIGDVHGVREFDKAWEMLGDAKPNLVLIDWNEPREPALEFVRRVRSAEDSPNRGVLMLMLANRGGLGDVGAARAAGIDGYLRKPICARAIHKHVRSMVAHPNLLNSDADRAAERARFLAAEVEARATAMAPGDVKSIRELRSANQRLTDLSLEIGDGVLNLGAHQLFRYIDACEQELSSDTDALRAHSTALFKLALMPASLSKERERISLSLKEMIDHKFGAAAAAAS